MLRVAAVLLLFAHYAYATTVVCSPPVGTPLCQDPQRSGEIAFVGRVLATNRDQALLVNPKDGRNIWHRFAVLENLVGLRGEQKQVFVRSFDTLGQFKVGPVLFVHARRSGHDLQFVECGNTRPVEKASLDIEYLRAQQKGEFKPFIAGSILRHYYGHQYTGYETLDGAVRGLPGARVAIQGPGGTRTLTADAEGRFRFDRVAPGRYTVRPTLPGYVSAAATSVEVPSNGCGVAHIGMFTNAGISGVVRYADGRPAANVELDLLDVDSRYLVFHDVFTRDPAKPIRTNARGEFSAEQLPSGGFLLGVNVKETSRYPDRTPPTFYPGVEKRTEAAVIQLAPNEKKQGLVLTLLPPRKFRRVRVHIRWPNGGVPRHGSVEAWVNHGVYVSDYGIRTGTVDLNLLEGVDYWLTASAQGEFLWGAASTPHIYTDNYRITAGTQPLEITLVAHRPISPWMDAIYPQ